MRPHPASPSACGATSSDSSRAGAASMARPGAALLALVLRLLAPAPGAGGGKSGHRGLRHPPPPVLSLRARAGPGCRSRARRSPPVGGRAAWWGSSGLRLGAQREEGASCCGLRRNSCRRRSGRGCPGIWGLKLIICLEKVGKEACCGR